MSIQSVSVSGMSRMRMQIQQFGGQGNPQKIEGKKASDPQRTDSLSKVFDDIDTNNDDGISLDELKSFVEENSSQAQQQRPAGPPPGMLIIGLKPGGMEQTQRPEQEQGGISKDALTDIKNTLEENGIEVPSGLTDMIKAFDSIDANQSGEINIDELMKFYSEQGEAGGAENAQASSGSSDASSESMALKDLLQQAQGKVEQQMKPQDTNALFKQSIQSYSISMKMTSTQTQFFGNQFA